MWAVKVNISTDGDFSYEDSELLLPERDENGIILQDTDLTFYFEHRSDAVSALLKSFRNVTESFHTRSCDHIKQWLAEMNGKLPLLCRKFKSFDLDEDFGNQKIEYALCKCRYPYGQNSYHLPNGAAVYPLADTSLNIGWYGLGYGDISWNEIEKLPDIEPDTK